jgi:apolipoprotein N-acyltransferase
MYLFSNGELSTIVGVILAPIFFMKLIESISSRAVGCATVLAIIYPAFLIQWQNYIPAPMPLYIFIALGNSILFAIPYLIIVLIGGKSTGRYIILPSGFVVIEFILANLSPYGSWGALPYSVSRIAFLEQIVAITGIYGITFLFYYTSMILLFAFNKIIKNNSYSMLQKSDKLFIWTYIVALIGTFLYGVMRLQYHTSQKSIYAAGITVPLSNKSIIFSEIDYEKQIGRPLQSVNNIFMDVYLLNKTIPEQYRSQTEKWFRDIQHKLLFETEKAADLGAKYIIWSEGNGVCLDYQEEQFLSECTQIAKRKNITLLATFNTKKIGQNLSENKVVAIQNNGNIAFEYIKSFPVPGAENSVAGNGFLKSMQTPDGIITSVICFDADFPSLVRQTSDLQANILFVPAFDWEAINPYHTEMIRFRAIENGCTVFRQVNNGLSAVYDATGKELHRKNFTIDNSEHIFLASIPTERKDTIYSIVNDIFAWLNVALFILMCVLQYKLKLPSKNNEKVDIH